MKAVFITVILLSLCIVFWSIDSVRFHSDFNHWSSLCFLDNLLHNRKQKSDICPHLRVKWGCSAKYNIVLKLLKYYVHNIIHKIGWRKAEIFQSLSLSLRMVLFLLNVIILIVWLLVNLLENTFTKFYLCTHFCFWTTVIIQIMNFCFFYLYEYIYVYS